VIEICKFVEKVYVDLINFNQKGKVFFRFRVLLVVILTFSISFRQVADGLLRNVNEIADVVEQSVQKVTDISYTSTSSLLLLRFSSCSSPPSFLLILFSFYFYFFSSSLVLLLRFSSYLVLLFSCSLLLLLLRFSSLLLSFMLLLNAFCSSLSGSRQVRPLDCNPRESRSASERRKEPQRRRCRKGSRRHR
jgi:hypothetical protein